MARGWLALILAAVLAAPVMAQQPAKLSPLQFGPLTFGGGIAQAKAEAPDAQWSIRGRAPSGAPVYAVAPNAFEFAGFSVDAAVTSERYNSRLSLIHRAPDPISAQNCLDAAKAWMRAIRDTTGPLSAGAPYSVTAPQTTQFLTQRIEGNLVIIPLTSGGGTKTFGEKTEFASGEFALLDALRNAAPHPLAKWARKPPTAFTLSAAASTATDAALRRVSVVTTFEAANKVATGACRHSVEVAQDNQPPPPTAFAFSPEKVRSQPSIAQRHAAAVALGDKLTAPIAVTAACKVDRPSGLVSACARHDPLTAQPSALTASERAALRLGDAYALDTSGVDRDDPQHMTVTLPLSLGPEDVRPLDFAAAPLVDTKKLKLKYGPNSEAIMRFYPREALNKGQEGLVTVRCQIQTDGSTICGFPEGRTPEETATFGAAALRVMATGLLFDTVTRDGQPSAGLVFRQSIGFLLAN